MPSRREQRREEALAALKMHPEAHEDAVHGLAARILKTAVLIEKQGQRIAVESFEQAQLDTDLLVLSLRSLVTSASALGDVGIDVAPHLARFDGAFPEAKAARDVLAHPEDYLLGAGDLQVEPGVPMEMVYERGVGGTAIHMTNPDLTLDVGRIIPAAVELTNGVLEAAHDWLDARTPAEDGNSPD